MAPTQGDAPPPTGPGPNTGYGLVPEDELDYEESTGGSPSPLSSREEGEIPEANIITNPLDEAQGRQLEQQRGAPPSNIPEARPLVSDSQQNYGFRPRDPAVVAREAAQQLLPTYVIGPEATTPDQVAARTQLREQYLKPQRTTPSEYTQHLSDKSNNLSVPDMRRIPVVFRPGELSHEADAQFQNWHRGFREWVAGQLSRFADDLEQAEHHVDEVADQASQGVEKLGNQQADRMAALERSNVELRDLAARLQGQIDLLVRLQRSGAQQ
ncbi:hypothetical protein PHPALM_2001 [Phytophthora palmivora]|uniref:Uncharacterized protein n=1 Tax=Phytophthora palmivora TaxID=4796 RepID=A0A2P4YQY3_9STRA|nr:hypothetical protein PHPALM_2001 [Phytophthora palmivora]